MSVLLSFSFFLAITPIVGVSYARFFRKSSEVFISATTGLGQGVRVEASLRDGSQEKDVALFGRGPVSADTEIVIQAIPTDEPWFVTSDSQTVGYLPLIVFLAFWVSTPLCLRRRVQTLLIGGALVHVYVLLRVGLIVVFGLTVCARQCAGRHAHVVFLDDDWWIHALTKAIAVLHMEPTLCMAVPIVVWAGIAFRSQDWSELIGQREKEARPPTSFGASNYQELL